MLDIGTKFLLHKIPFPDITPEIDEFVIVSIIDRRNDVPCMWTGKKEYDGYKAEDELGNIYECNWGSFPSDAMTPMWRWTRIKPTFEFWYDVTYVRNIDFKPIFIDRFEDIVGWCESHKCLYHKTEPNQDCALCHFSIEEYPIYKTEKNFWNGWKIPNLKP